jgi:competence protein ComEC
LALGVALGDRAGWAPTVWFFLLVPVLAGYAFLIWRGGRRTYAIALVAVGLALLGGWRIAIENVDRPSAALLELESSRAPIESFGRLSGVPYQKSSGWRARFDLHAIRGPAGVVPVRARLLLRSRQPLTGWRVGDYLRLDARFTRPFTRRNPGGFDYAAYLHRQGIDGLIEPVGLPTHWPRTTSRYRPENLVEPIRQWVRHSFAAGLPQQSEAVLLGLLLGDTDRLSSDIFTAFRESGTLHLLAVSGANVWLVVGVFLLPLRFLRVPRWPRTVILLLIVAAFSFLTRNEPSVVRAALMVGMILTGRLFYRPVDVLNAVGAAGIVILVLSPSHLFRPGFQLSFAAVLAIATVIRRFGFLTRGHRWRVMRAGIMVALSSLAAGIATMPIVAAHFGTVPIMGVAANLVMVPLAGIITQIGVLYLMIGAFSASLAGILAIPLVFLIDLTVGAAGLFSSIPGAVISWANPGITGVLLWYLGIVLILAWRYRYTWMRPLSFAVAIVLVVTVSRDLYSTQAPRPSLAFLDAGRSRVMALHDGRQHTAWVAEGGEVDADLHHWVVDPFERGWTGEGVTRRWLPWRRSGQLLSEEGAARLERDTDPASVLLWRRFGTALDHPAEYRIWGDLFGLNADTLVFIRDYPDDGLASGWLSGIVGPGHVLVVPIGADQRMIRETLDQLVPRTVIFQGRARWRQYPDQHLALWRIRYPETEFWSTDSHGGIVIDFWPDKLRITPTISG